MQCYKNYYSEGESSQVDIYGTEWGVPAFSKGFTEEEARQMNGFIVKICGGVKGNFNTAINKRFFLFGDLNDRGTGLRCGLTTT